MIETLLGLFPGIGTLFAVDPLTSVVRTALIFFGILLAYLGFKRTLEPLIMVPMGLGMIAVNAGTMFLAAGAVGNIIIDPLVTDAVAVTDAMQINFLQPVYNLTFSNGLIACLVFMGIGARSEISFLLAMPWTSIVIALFAELGTFVTLVLGVKIFGLSAPFAAAIATIGGADGPMVLVGSMMMAPELFVPISVIAYLYLSLTYAGYPGIIKALVPKKYRGLDTFIEMPEVPQKAKFSFIVLVCAFLCLILPAGAPLFVSFFLGMAVKEADLGHYTELLENQISYFATLFLGLMLGALCEAATILDPTVLTILILGVVALTVSAAGGLAGGWILYLVHKKKGREFNPVIGISGVSCVPTTAKLAQHAAQEENPFAVILPVAMGASLSGVIVSAIATGVFITTIGLVAG
ncbi:MAG: sodium ion-translocating decarboxylase subunit beta [Oscillospiraceae bacterium]|nr:sodium ion-translocating decarboxylase subunit beta [Oscillospiraceae bacterium]